jgi:hypothetical protein
MMHQLNSANTSGSRSGINSSKNSNRPSKTSINEVDKYSSNNDNIFERASIVL